MEAHAKDLSRSGIKPVVLEEISLIAKHCGLDRVLLFGSRARGDCWRASDIDLAVEGGNVLQFALSVKEETSTLLDFDVIDLGQRVSEDLLESIRKEGIPIYEKI